MAIRTAFGAGLYGAPSDLGDSALHGLPLTIEETSGRLRGLRLRGWCLPETPLELAAERLVTQRTYPGQSEATQHVVGYTDGSTTIRGEWCTQRLLENDYALALTAGAEQSAFRSAEDLREYVYAIVRAGQPLRVEWAGLERRATAIRARIGHRSRLDLTWEMTFDWSGVGKFVQLPAADAAESSSTDLLNKIGELLALAAYPANLALDVLDYADMQIKRVGGLVTELRKTLELYASILTRTTEVAGRVLGLATTVQAEAKALRDTLRAIPADAASNLGIGGGGASGAAEARVLAAWLADTHRASNQTAAAAAKTAAVFAELTLPQIEAIVTIQGDTDLRYIARQRYGSADQWTRIADYNGLTGSAVSGGQVIYIPRLDKAAA